MRKLLSKGLVMAMVLGAGFVCTGAFNTPVVEAAAVNIEFNIGVENYAVDFEQGYIMAQGSGALNPKFANNPGQQRLMARRAAFVDGYRNIAEAVNGVSVDANTDVKNMLAEDDSVRAAVSATIKGARVLEEKYDEALQVYTVKMVVPLHGVGSIAAATIPAVNKKEAIVAPEPVAKVDVKATPLPPVEVKQVQQAAYTGVIIDARGLDLAPTFSPVIYDVNGRAVYGMKNIDPNMAISKGMVEYSKDLQQASVNSRAGSNPLVLKANAVKGGANSVNKVNVVVSVEDADKILLANEKSGMLGQCAVVFVR